MRENNSIMKDRNNNIMRDRNKNIMKEMNKNNILKMKINKSITKNNLWLLNKDLKENKNKI